MANRDEIFDTLRNIIVETRGVEEDEVTSEATLFGSLGLESIDMLEISFRMEEEFGFPFPTDELGNALGNLGEDSSQDEISATIDQLSSDFFLPIEKGSLNGLDPFEPTVLRDEILNLFNVDFLVGFVEKRQAASA